MPEKLDSRWSGVCAWCIRGARAPSRVGWGALAAFIAVRSWEDIAERFYTQVRAMRGFPAGSIDWRKWIPHPASNDSGEGAELNTRGRVRSPSSSCQIQGNDWIPLGDFPAPGPSSAPMISGTSCG
ncbi:MAG: hypothetical protein ORN51_03300 [Akkermansiaceae bacterium]|nr:hypothetical protein [Akkermansiaceae bacterium]